MRTITLSSLFSLLVAPVAVAQTNWTQLTPSPSPLPVGGHAMAFDIAAGVSVLFGGSLSGVRNNETWLWDRANWTQVTPAVAPPARVAHSMAYDIGRGRCVVFGGIDATGSLLGDTWEWNGTNWLATAPTAAPIARRSYPMAYHLASGRVVLFGGFSTVDHNDTWAWDGTNWTQLTTASAPSPRRAAEMALDPVSGNLILFSGYQQPNDTWSFDGIDWTLLTPATSPSARYDHSMVTDFARNRIVMFGGTSTADTWEWDGTTWINRTPAASPSNRVDSYMTYDWVDQKMVLYGGAGGLGDTWSYGPVWPTSFTTAGTGCPGTNNQAPQANSNGNSWVGETVVLGMSGLAPGAVPFVLLGFSNTVSALHGPLPLPLDSLGMPGCSLQVDPEVGLLAPTGTVALAIPNNAALLGLQVYHQPAVVDLGANATGVITGNHGITMVGGK